ncbi:hypothetical protein Trydic_g1890 [Trypoxylus dichotomus]
MPEAKEQPKQWTLPGESVPKKANTVPSTGKVIFCDSQGGIVINYLQKRTITGRTIRDKSFEKTPSPDDRPKINKNSDMPSNYVELERVGTSDGQFDLQSHFGEGKQVKRCPWSALTRQTCRVIRTRFNQDRREGWPVITVALSTCNPFGFKFEPEFPLKMMCESRLPHDVRLYDRVSELRPNTEEK